MNSIQSREISSLVERAVSGALLEAGVEVKRVSYSGSSVAGQVQMEVELRGVPLVEAHVCGNCQRAWEEGDLNDIEDFEMRHGPGDAVGSGECPVCGALTFPEKVSADTEFASRDEAEEEEEEDV